MKSPLQGLPVSRLMLAEIELTTDIWKRNYNNRANHTQHACDYREKSQGDKKRRQRGLQWQLLGQEHEHPSYHHEGN